MKCKISQLFMVDLKGFEPSTSRMRTERSPKADILHPHAFDSLDFCTILLKLWLVYQKNVIVKKRHEPLVLLKKIQVLIIFCKTSLQDIFSFFQIFPSANKSILPSEICRKNWRCNSIWIIFELPLLLWWLFTYWVSYLKCPVNRDISFFVHQAP